MIAIKALVWGTIVLVHGTVTVAIPWLVLLVTGPGLRSGEVGAFRLLGFVPTVGGALILLWSGWNLTVVGKGTPAPFDPPKELVAKGAHRVVRNPMYVGDLLVLLGLALLFGAAALLLYALLMACIFHLFVVLYEEPVLKRQFGDGYERYRQVVPRWLPNGRTERRGASPG